MEHFPQQENKKELTLQEELKRDFLNDKMTLLEFRDRYFEIEGIGTHIENSEANIELLENKEVYEKILNFGSEYGEEGKKFLDAKYHGMLGFSYFHKGQKDVSYDDFKKSHELVEKAWYVPENRKVPEENFLEHTAWLKYIEGTLAYLESNKDILGDRINEITELNQQIVEIAKNSGKELDPESQSVNLNILKRFFESLKAEENPKENYYKRYNNE